MEGELDHDDSTVADGDPVSVVVPYEEGTDVTEGDADPESDPEEEASDEGDPTLEGDGEIVSPEL